MIFILLMKFLFLHIRRHDLPIEVINLAWIVSWLMWWCRLGGVRWWMVGLRLQHSEEEVMTKGICFHGSIGSCWAVVVVFFFFFSIAWDISETFFSPCGLTSLLYQTTTSKPVLFSSLSLRLQFTQSNLCFCHNNSSNKCVFEFYFVQPMAKP